MSAPAGTTAATYASGRTTQVSPGYAPNAVVSVLGKDVRRTWTGAGKCGSTWGLSRSVSSRKPVLAFSRDRPRGVGTSGMSVPGAGTGRSPRGGRTGFGRPASGVVSGESGYQNGSANRPESTSETRPPASTARL